MGADIGNLHAAYHDIAMLGVELAKGFAPRGRTGHLIRSIHGYSKPGYVTIRATAVYAGPINYGWRKRNIAAAHFMQRADRSIRPHVEMILRNAIDRAIAKGGFK